MGTSHVVEDVHETHDTAGGRARARERAQAGAGAEVMEPQWSCTLLQWATGTEKIGLVLIRPRMKGNVAS
jgi:hypothetical protein